MEHDMNLLVYTQKSYLLDCIGVTEKVAGYTNVMSQDEDGGAVAVSLPAKKFMPGRIVVTVRQATEED